MKQRMLTFLFKIILLTAVCGIASAEEIQSFDARYEVQQDGHINVTEKIIYDFGDLQKHGIFRAIPLDSPQGPHLHIHMLDVQDENAQAYPYQSDVEQNILMLKIGDAQNYLSGTHNFIIHYQLDNAIRTHENQNEFYWNVTGNKWQVPILETSGTVVLPENITNPQTICFTGDVGSAEKNCRVAQKNNTLQFASTQALSPGAGLTLAVAFPVGYLHIAKPSLFLSVSDFVAEYFPLGVFGFFFLLMLWVGFKKNRGASADIDSSLKNKPIVVQYNPPDNLPAIDVGAILARGVDAHDIASIMIDLAVNGYLKIQYVVKPHLVFSDDKDLNLVKLKSGDDLTHPAYQIVFDAFFADANEVLLKDWVRHHPGLRQTLLPRVTELTETQLAEEGYFSEDNALDGKQWLKRCVAGIVIIVAMIFLFSNPVVSLLGAMGIAVLVIGLIYSQRMKTILTVKGIETQAKILGFQEFLRLTETDRLRLLDAPKRQPETFSQFLPYAMVLGVEKEWAKQFEGICTAYPSWFEGPSGMAFNTMLLMNNLDFMNSSLASSFENTQGSASGFSGGFSGGGSGGGGGGSW